MHDNKEPTTEKTSGLRSTEDEGASLEDVDLGKEVFDSSAIDPVLAKKMALINSSIDEIGMTPWHWRVFCLNGFGYAVDSVREYGRSR